MAIRLGEGRWALSRIVVDSGGGFTIAAIRDLLADNIEAYYPPMNETRSGFALGFAAVRLQGNVQAGNADTRLIPNALLDATLRDLTAAQRNRLRTEIEEWFTGYQFTDFDGSVTIKQAFSAAGYTLDTPIRQILRDLFGHLGHSESRPRQFVPESHNTEFLDDFSTDPYSAPRWTNESGTNVWDSGNSELDMNPGVDHPGARYSVNGPGSIEHEAQVSNLVNTGLGPAGTGGAVRFDNTGVNDWYCCWVSAGTTIHLGVVLGDTRIELTSFSFTYTSGNFVTIRLAAAGAAGANVDLSIWRNHNGASKPSDPGWYGADGTPDHTYTDSSVDRLDASSHAHCGIGGRGQGSDYDTRCCFWKSRAISDRTVAVASGGSRISRLLAQPMLRGPM